MKILFRQEPPKEVMDIVKQAVEEAISPIDFCKKLEKLGVEYSMFPAYLTNFFDIDYLTAKTISFKFRFGDIKARPNSTYTPEDDIPLMYAPLKAHLLF